MRVLAFAPAPNERGKIGRVQACLRAGLHVLADKPWIIEREDLPQLEETLRLARQSVR